MVKIILHIGKHKTGSTSFQLLLRKSHAPLEEIGFHPLPHRVGNRLASFAIRDHLPIPPLLDRKGVKPSKESLIEDIRALTEDKNFHTYIISSEHLSYLRTTEEIELVKSCLPPQTDISVFLVLRNQEDFLNSYREQITSSGHGPKNDPSSPYYCEPDSWLLDDETLVNSWKSVFPNIKILDYQRENMLKNLGRAMGFPEEILDKEIRLNINSPRWKAFKNHLRKILKATPLGQSSLRKFRQWK